MKSEKIIISYKDVVYAIFAGGNKTVKSTTYFINYCHLDRELLLGNCRTILIFDSYDLSLKMIISDILEYLKNHEQEKTAQKKITHRYV